MADNPAFRDRLRRIVNRGDEIAEGLAVRPTTVTLRVRQYSGPVGVHGTTLTSTTDTVVSPRPVVQQVRQGPKGDQVGWLEGASLTDATGQPRTLRYEVGPIALTFTSGSGGGYAPADFTPTDDATRRLTIVLAGPDFGADPVEFEVIRTSADDPLTFTLTVQRTRQGA
jgi:hypothetical protein